MSISLSRGQKIKLSDLFSNFNFSIRINAQSSKNTTYDISCCGTDNHNKCLDESYFIFYNQTSSPKTAVLLNEYNENFALFDVNLKNLPSNITKLIFTITIDGDGIMSEVINGNVTILKNNKVIARFDFIGSDFDKEKSLMVAEVYLKAEWRLGIIGQGFNGGLSDLLKYFGIEEAQDANTTTPNNNNIVSPEIHQIDDKKVKLFQRRLKKDLLDGDLTSEKIKKLEQFCREHHLNFDEMLDTAKPEVEKALHKIMADIVFEERISTEEQNTINRLCNFVGAPTELVKEINQTITRIKRVEKIKNGEIEPIKTKSIVLRNSEICWCHISKVYSAIDSGDEIDAYEGDIFITSERVIFKSPDVPLLIPFQNIVSFEIEDDFFYIHAKNTKSNISICSTQRKNQLINAYLEQALNKYNRRIGTKTTKDNTRSISQVVKNIVWTRDGGQCVECGATDYLEYDHIIPFSKGGSNSEKNIQLLCRRCNLNKRNRI